MGGREGNALALQGLVDRLVATAPQPKATTRKPDG